MSVPPCAKPQRQGWKCKRASHPSGTACALIPKWWNLNAHLYYLSLRWRYRK